ncbi:hypothetical protein SISNIDRAFT_162798 [Sistotremastrum niveocremeum HHB9708]|uniref:Uncharacterized protein n=1 Tax=Sistotremastrum niveocremeum HHB9708 TaxID=1314777 RepID=A0A164SN87_9AGAM|nr:hypothetical protein SISNIDRAFT_162798 [Sistotremastrum niveocremeum HHB9708]
MLRSLWCYLLFFYFHIRHLFISCIYSNSFCIFLAFFFLEKIGLGAFVINRLITSRAIVIFIITSNPPNFYLLTQHRFSHFTSLRCGFHESLTTFRSKIFIDFRSSTDPITSPTLQIILIHQRLSHSRIE